MMMLCYDAECYDAEGVFFYYALYVDNVFSRYVTIQTEMYA